MVCLRQKVSTFSTIRMYGSICLLFETPQHALHKYQFTGVFLECNSLVILKLSQQYREASYIHYTPASLKAAVAPTQKVLLVQRVQKTFSLSRCKTSCYLT